MTTDGTRPLFDRYPELRASIPHVDLGALPTPVQHAQELGERLGVGGLYIKRDDLSGDVYGGNKVRKLEFLFGDALARGAREVLTFGAAGSNHALATAVYARELGLGAHEVLMPQPNARYVGRNLLAGAGAGAQLHYFEDRKVAMSAAETIAGEDTYVIPFGGTTALSAAGDADAGLELAKQVEAGELPVPDVVYVAFGSMGTAAGVALGLALAGIEAEVRAVRVVPALLSPVSQWEALVADALTLLAAGGASIPDGALDRVRIVEGYLGEGYALFTPEGVEAIELVREHAGVTLEGTYTGKTFAALAADARAGELAGRNVVFWNTYNSHDLSPLSAGIDYRELPEGLHAYFETAVQPLDAVLAELGA